MNRRKFLLASTGTLLVVAAGGIGYRRATVRIPSIASLLAQLEAMRSQPLHSLTSWSPYQVFTHLAQSIEYSISGYPAQKSALFQHTLGRAAFEAFSLAGTMRHKLTEAIPGAPDIAARGPQGEAIDRVIAALRAFEQHSGPLQPHFAYGLLDKADYAHAHALHIRNHLERIQLAA